jgi:hypothetical protein
LSIDLGRGMENVKSALSPLFQTKQGINHGETESLKQLKKKREKKKHKQVIMAASKYALCESSWELDAEDLWYVIDDLTLEEKRPRNPVGDTLNKTEGKNDEETNGEPEKILSLEEAVPWTKYSPKALKLANLSGIRVDEQLRQTSRIYLEHQEKKEFDSAAKTLVGAENVVDEPRARVRGRCPDNPRSHQPDTEDEDVGKAYIKFGGKRWYY